MWRWWYNFLVRRHWEISFNWIWMKFRQNVAGKICATWSVGLDDLGPPFLLMLSKIPKMFKICSFVALATSVRQHAFPGFKPGKNKSYIYWEPVDQRVSERKSLRDMVFYFPEIHVRNFWKSSKIWFWLLWKRALFFYFPKELAQNHLESKSELIWSEFLIQ